MQNDEVKLLSQKVCGEILRSAAILRPEELAITVEAIFDRALSAIPSTVSGETEYRPQIIHYDGAGDPYWQFVERDVPTVTGQVFAANIEMLTDFDGNIVGFTIYDPSPANPAETQAGEVGK